MYEINDSGFIIPDIIFTFQNDFFLIPVKHNGHLKVIINKLLCGSNLSESISALHGKKDGELFPLFY
jgi:hypothetical protein